jgi:hypothetical protein
MRRRRVWFAVFVPAALWPASAQAQVGRSSSDPFVETSAGRAWQRITFGAIDCASDAPVCANDPFSVLGIFVNGTYRDIRANYGGDPLVPNAAEFLGNRVATQSQTFPTASSASGFTFTWRGGPTPTLDSEMFGPLFGERGRTNGRGQLSATFTVQRMLWESLDGSQIRNDQPGLLWGDADYVDGFGYVGRCRMNIDSTIASIALNYGLSDRLDVSVALPLVRTTVDGSNEFLDFVDLGGGVLSADPADTGFEPQGRFFVRGTSRGIGDVQIGASYAAIKEERSALALTARAALGTGSLDKMTGTGATQVRVGLVGSFETGGVAPHASVAYVFASEELFDEVTAIAGIDLKAVPNRLTLSGEFVARRLFDVQGFVSGRTLGTLVSPVTGDVFEVADFRAERGNFNLFFATIGAKLRVAGQLLASAYVLVPAGSSGLQAQKPTFNFGFNYAF